MLVVHLDALTADQVTVVDGVRLTSIERTAADLSRWTRSLTEAVVAVDALSAAGGFDPVVIMDLVSPGSRGAARVPRVISLADRRSQSPMETRVRLTLVLAGLPPPIPQHPVVLSGREFALDLAYPEVKLAIEYNGADHRRARSVTSSASSSWWRRLAHHPLRRGHRPALSADDRRPGPP